MLEHLLQLFSAIGALITRYPAILDGIRLAVAGLLFQSFRRGLDGLIAAAMRACTMTVYVDVQDEVYGWLMEWSTSGDRFTALREDVDDKQDKSANVHPDVAARSRSGLAAEKHSLRAVCRDMLEEFWPTGLTTPRALELGVSTEFTPSWRNYYCNRSEPVSSGDKPVAAKPARGHKVQITLSVGYDKLYTNDHGMQISIFRGTLSTYAALIEHVRKLSEDKSNGELSIYTPGGNVGSPMSSLKKWGKVASRPLRPWESVVLPREMKAGLLADAKEFIEEQAFYRERGLPWRRGYLLHGVPGAGKSSLIAALASKLGLGIYMLNLGAKDLDDSRLLLLLQGVPAKSILVIEDVDCAFDHRKKLDEGADKIDAEVTDLTKEEPKEEPTAPAVPKGAKAKAKEPEPNTNRVTLSGLLNALDGVASSEGRLLFCTTNYVDRIDDALSRPGRCDVWLEFKNTTSEQIRDLFIRFYAPLRTVTLTSADSKLISGKAGQQMNGDTHAELDHLADQFVAALPQDTVSSAALQAYLMRFKRMPQAAVNGLEEWIRSGYRQGTRAPTKASAAEVPALRLDEQSVRKVNGHPDASEKAAIEGAKHGDGAAEKPLSSGPA